jgi:predicted phage terminase large subunit-like protein
MTSPTATTPATDFANPSITFETFAGALLGPWLSDDADQAAGPSLSSPRAAAARAAYEAAIVHSGKRGTILVTASDGSLVRACLDFLKAYFEDQPQLAPLVKRVSSDEIALRRGTRILVTTSPRRPRDLLAAITLTTKPAVAPAERQTEAIQSLIAFTEHTYARYRSAVLHKAIAEQLERVERGEIDRLQLLVPPRHGKSELASRRFPAWYLGRHPERQFISVSATEDLATDYGRDVRNIIASEGYGAVFDTVLAADSQAAGKWHTSEGGIFYAVGIGGAVKGRGAHVLLIDDPFAKMEAALSEVERKRVWDWFTGTAYDRLMPGGAIVLINHRMHEDDLSGMLLQQQAAGGDAWEVVELKALAEEGDPLGRKPGEALWPEAYPVEALDRIRKNIQPRFWSALYQQNPTPEEGDYFKADWLRPYDKTPPRGTMRVYGGSDYAVTAEGGDFTVHLIVGLDPEGRMYLLDLWRKQTAADAWIESFCDLVKQWKPLAWAEETGQIRSGVGPFLTRRQRERGAYVFREQFPTRGDKSVRAQSIRGRMALEGLYVPINAPWYPAFCSELLNFPAGRHDDQVDALSLVGQLLDQMVKGRAPDPKEDRTINVRRPTWNEMFARHRRGLRKLEDAGLRDVQGR